MGAPADKAVAGLRRLSSALHDLVGAGVAGLAVPGDRFGVRAGDDAPQNGARLGVVGRLRPSFAVLDTADRLDHEILD